MVLLIFATLHFQTSLKNPAFPKTKSNGVRFTLDVSHLFLSLTFRGLFKPRRFLLLLDWVFQVHHPIESGINFHLNSSSYEYMTQDSQGGGPGIRNPDSYMCILFDIPETRRDWKNSFLKHSTSHACILSPSMSSKTRRQ